VRASLSCAFAFLSWGLCRGRYVFGGYGFGRVGFGGFGEAYIYGDIHNQYDGGGPEPGILFTPTPTEGYFTGIANSGSSSSSSASRSDGSGSSGSEGRSSYDGTLDLPMSEVLTAQALNFVAWAARAVTAQRLQWVHLAHRFVGCVILSFVTQGFILRFP